MKRPGRYAALAAAYYDDMAIIEAGEAAEVMYTRLLAWCAGHPETDGRVPETVVLTRLGFPTGVPGDTSANARLSALAAAGLVTVDDNQVRVVSWLKWNEKYANIKSARKKAAVKKRRQRAEKSEGGQPDVSPGDNPGDNGTCPRDVPDASPRDIEDKEKGERRKEDIEETKVSSSASQAADAPAPPAKTTTPASKTSGKTRGTRIPEDWQPSPALVAWTREHAPAAATNAEVSRFLDYWRAIPGARGRKTDWAATWRNWARRAQEDHDARQRRAPAPGARGGSTTDERVAAWIALADALPGPAGAGAPQAAPRLAIEGGAA